MDQSSLLHRHLNQNFYLKQLPKIDKPASSDKSTNFRVSAFKISPHPCTKSKKTFQQKSLANTKERIVFKNPPVPKPIQKSSALQLSASQDCLDSQRAYWKKLEESEFRQSLKSRSSMFKRDASSFVIKTLYLPHSVKNLLSRTHTSQCSKYKKFLNSIENDPYLSGNYFLNPKCTSFYELLDIRYENPTFFPYFNKNNRELCKDTMVVPIKFPSNMNTYEDNVQLPKKRPNFNEISKKTIKSLVNLLFSPQKVASPYNFIIINFESICKPDSISLRQGVLQVLQPISQDFHIIIVTSHFDSRFEEIVEDLALDEINVSAVYKVLDPGHRNWKIVDYSEVFEDFRIENPISSCIIVTNHNVCEESEDWERIGNRFGASFKLNCEKVGTCSLNYKSIPIHLLIPSFNSTQGVDLLMDVFNYLHLYLAQHFYMRNKLSFETLLKSTQFNLIESNIPGFLIQKLLNSSSSQPSLLNTKLKNLFLL